MNQARPGPTVQSIEGHGQAWNMPLGLMPVLVARKEEGPTGQCPYYLQGGVGTSHMSSDGCFMMSLGDGSSCPF